MVFNKRSKKMLKLAAAAALSLALAGSAHAQSQCALASGSARACATLSSCQWCAARAYCTPRSERCAAGKGSTDSDNVHENLITGLVAGTCHSTSELFLSLTHSCTPPRHGPACGYWKPPARTILSSARSPALLRNKEPYTRVLPTSHSKTNVSLTIMCLL